MNIPISFVGQAYEGRLRAIDSERCLNWYPEVNSEKSKSVLSLAPTPGAKRIEILPASNRGGFEYDGKIWTVASNKLYSVTTDGVSVEKGTLNSFNGDIDFAENGNEMLLVDGTDGYIYNKSADTFAQIADPDFPPNPMQVEFLDGFFIVLEGGTGRFWKSGLRDGTAWNGLEFATAEGSPDNLLAMKVINRQIWLIGNKSTEIWYNAGNKDFPFLRVQGSFIEEGVLAPQSVAKTINAAIWLSRSERGMGAVYISSGGIPTRVSTLGVEYAFDSYSTLTDAIGYTFYEEGHLFYVLTFPTAEKTWVYDLSTNMWHQRSTNNKRWWAQYGVVVEGALYGLDYGSGRIMHIDHTYMNEDGQLIRRVRAGRHIHNNRDRLECNSVEIEFEHGLGDFNAPDPQVMFRVSRDGGYTWAKERRKSAGKQGDYRSRVKFNRLGTSRDFVFEVSVSDEVPWNMVEAMSELVAVQ